MSTFSRFTPLVAGLSATIPFVGPEAIERQRGLKVLARIGANENGFGPSPKVISAMQAAAADSWHYSDPENFALKTALARHFGVTPDNINVGVGIDGLLGQIVRMVIAPGDAVVTSLGAYPTFNYHVNGFGGRLVPVPYVNDREDLDGLLAAVKRENAPLCYLANPDNPMGSWHSAADIEAFAKTLPETTLLVLDEAYGETAPAGTLPPMAALIDHPNIIRTRTFSKAYGLAGARIGVVISTPGTAGAFDKIRDHFAMNCVAIAGALAALEDQDYLGKVVGKIAASRDRISQIARANTMEPLVSATNFVAIDTGRDGVYARAIVDGLMQHGVFIRMPGVAPLNRCIRVSTGTDSDMALLAESLPIVLNSLN